MPASIVSVGTAVPDFRIPQDDIKDAVRRMFGTRLPQLDKLLTIFEHSGIETRHFCTPLEWFHEVHSIEEKHALFVKHAVDLAERAIIRCMAKVNIPPSEIDHIIFVTTTGTATPSIDAHLVNRLGFKSNIKRSPLWGLGCAGGAAGLSRASEYAKAFPEELVLLVSVELCSLTFLLDDASKSNIVATSLFADGAAAALVTGRADIHNPDDVLHPQILTTQSTIWPDSLDVMGWDVTKEGMKVVFSKDIPTLVHRSMRGIVDSLIEPCGLTAEEIGLYVLHPGGMKVLKAYGEALAVKPGALSASERVLRAYGNMSSCTMLFVLEETLKHPAAPTESRYGIAGALGPGFSSELLLLHF
jgi:alkylresorcinol/alkylpyrone synthase